jgi:hypothetical protein
MAQKASKVVYEGDWVTVNRKLDGTMKCEVTDLGGGQWKGKFWGTWQGVSFSYDVKWSGPPEKLRGTARIDGADYEWTGSITENRFEGKFDGSRYRGHFDLKR